MEMDRRKQLVGMLFSMLGFVASMAIQDPKEDTFKMIGCLPCSQKFLFSLYFEKDDRLDDLNFQKFQSSGFSSLDSCSWHKKNTEKIELSIAHRELIGRGSHRYLLTSIVYEFGSEISGLDAASCRAVIVEKLPAGIFADPFELQHLVQFGAFLDAAVFGDTNLELPSALSNRTAVEIHMDIQLHTSQANMKGSAFTVKLPLHVRYPPLDGSGYSRVVMGKPNILVYCRPNSDFDDCSSPIMYRSLEYPLHDLEWLIPCGNEDHTVVVSLITFLSALVSALSIAYSALSSSPWKKDVKVE